MPVMPLLPFVHYKASEFHVGGNPGEVGLASARWVAFGEQALGAAASMRGITDGGFIGTEGDRYRELVHAQFPQHLDVTGQAHTGVGEAIGRYQVALVEALGLMNSLVIRAAVDHAQVQAAVAAYNAAELNAARAAVTAQVATASAVATSLVPGVNAATAATAAAAQADAAAAQSAFVAAQGRHAAAVAVWESDIVSAQGIKADLGVAVTAQVSVVQAQARKAFQENPSGLAALWEDIKDWVSEHAELLKVLSDALQIIGSIMLFIPGLQVLGAVFIGIGVGLKGLLAAAGEVSWGEFLFDLATCGAVGGLAKLAKLGKLGPMAARLAQSGSKMSTQALSTVKSLAKSSALRTANGLQKAFGEAGENVAKKAYSAVTRGREICFAAEPVDMATGNLVDFQTDVSIDGVLPLVVERNSNSAHQLGRALGPRWVSRMDVRIEVCADEVLMVGADGALVTFPPAPADGSEVRADGRAWWLSYGDGAYRVRDIAEGVTWVFAVAGSVAEHRAEGAVVDAPPSFGASSAGAGVRDGSVAQRVGAGVEIGVSALLHHTGASIEFEYEPQSGHMVAMRRSDGTCLEMVWDQRVGRVASVWVSNESTHPGEEALRLVSYEYDGYGQLRRVINSQAGVLRYHYDEQSRPCGWTDRNGVSYYYRFDEQGRVISQVGTGGMFANALVWLEDDGADAPVGGQVCVLIETAVEFPADPLEIGDGLVSEWLDRLEALPLVQALRDQGLSGAGLTGRGRDGERSSAHHQVPAGWLADEVLGDVRATVYRSTVAGDVWRIISPEGAMVDRAYNQFHQVVEETAASGGVHRVYRDERGVVIGEDLADGTSIAVTPGAWGRAAEVVGRDGLVTEYEVDEAGLVTAVTAPDGARTIYGYEWRVSGVVVSSVTDPSGVTMLVDCDGAGRVVARTDGAGRRWSMQRDVRGLVVESMNPVGETTVVAYSPEGWPVTVTHPDGTSLSARYDGEGNQIEAINEEGAVTRTRFTVFDTPAEVVDATGAVTRVVYNSQLEPVTLINADAMVWTYEYNLDGQVVREVDYNGYETRIDVDPDQRAMSITDGAGTVVTRRDKAGRVTTRTAGENLTRMHYDNAGRVVSIVTPETNVEILRDQWGRAKGETVALTSGETTSVVYDYSPAGQYSGTRLRLPDGTWWEESYARDEAGELSTVTMRVGDREDTSQIARVETAADAVGRRSRWTSGSVVREFGYDTRNRVTSDQVTTLDSRVAGGVRALAGREYRWRGDNALVAVIDQLAGQSIFDVDAVGRAIGVDHGDGAGGERYGFTPAGRLDHVSPGLRRFGEEEVSGAGTLARGDVEAEGTRPVKVGLTRYEYDAAGRVVRTVRKRLSKPPVVHQFFYRDSGQPIGFTSSEEPGVGWRYVYDGLGRRVAKEQVEAASGMVLSRVVFVHDRDVLVAQQETVSMDPQRQSQAMVWVRDPGTGELTGQVHLHHQPGVPGAPDKPVSNWSQAEVDAQFFALVTDLAGAPREILDTGTGEVVGRVTQSLYGQRSWTGLFESPLLFTGQYEDAESGWVYNRYRSYYPEAGVYGAQDPLGVRPNVSSAQGYVIHPGSWVDVLGLNAHQRALDKQTLKNVIDADSVVDGHPRLGHKLNPHVLELSRSAHPETATTFIRAMNDGQPDLLQRIGSDLGSANRRDAIRGWNGPLSPDEFPYASTAQGGTGSTVLGVSQNAQNSQGGMLGSFIRNNKVGIGDWFHVRLVE
ncbi:MAG: DUF6531 domain-containing protein [Corynebacterium sp.]|uniref:DUF6531 domain-containing protein n=1 Tax=Corynebacterium sp. TaxID=1720 RepID=UPI0026E07494|nr:DUF6531 domain-containing protein [Corynebacterium sp.]MDO5670440.1 DUF6531 domain-containing protein [Corynebacterium sp.]